MLAKVLSAALVGIDAHLIDVEVDIAGGLPQFSVVGLPDATVRESRDRVRSALKNTGFHFPAKKITVNLAPAGIKKEGSGLDLAIAIGILVAEEVIPSQNVRGRVCVGELSLDGHIKAITGALSIGIACRPDHSLLLPAENSQEAAVVQGVTAYPLHTLPEAVAFLNGTVSLVPAHADRDRFFTTRPVEDDDYGDVKGQDHAKRALDVVAHDDRRRHRDVEARQALAAACLAKPLVERRLVDLRRAERRVEDRQPAVRDLRALGHALRSDGGEVDGNLPAVDDALERLLRTVVAAPTAARPGRTGSRRRLP
jgi:hypothetical protein